MAFACAAIIVIIGKEALLFGVPISWRSYSRAPSTVIIFAAASRVKRRDKAEEAS